MRTSYPISTGNKNPTPENFRLEHYENRTEAISYSTVIGVRPIASDWIVSENLWGNTTARQMAALWPRVGDEFTRESFVRILDKIRHGETVEVS